MNTDASILVYKFRQKITGFNVYAEYTRPQLTFLALHPCLERSFKSTAFTTDLLIYGYMVYNLQYADIMVYCYRVYNLQYAMQIYWYIDTECTMLHINLPPTLSSVMSSTFPSPLFWISFKPENIFCKISLSLTEKKIVEQQNVLTSKYLNPIIRE